MRRLLRLLEGALALLPFVAAAVLGGVVGRTIPKPYFHHSVDWILYAALAPALLGFLVIAAQDLDEGGPPWLACLASLSAPTLAIAAGLLFGWSAWNTSSTALIVLIGAMVAVNTPLLAAIGLAVGAVFAAVDLSIDLFRGRIETFTEGAVFVVREAAIVAAIVMGLIITVSRVWDSGGGDAGRRWK